MKAAIEAIAAAVAQAAPPAGPYFVLRHSGRDAGAWRIVSSKGSLEAARVVYDRLATSLRQGAVVLWSAGQVIDARSAPRLRSRW